MADDRKLLRELALNITNYQYPMETESPENEKVASNSSEGSGPSPTESLPEENQSPDAAQADDDSDQLTSDGAGKKRRAHSVAEAPVHSESSSDGAVHSRKKRRTGESLTVSAATDDQEEERARFLELVRGRFPTEDDPYKIHGRLLAILSAFQKGEIVKSHAHGKGSIMLIGHGDLLQEFERLLKHDDEQDDWRSPVMKHFMRDIGRFLEYMRDITVEEIKKGLTADHLRRIDILIEDPMERIELVADLRKPDPSDALLRLRQKVDAVIERMTAFVSNYFGRDLDYAALFDGEGSSSGSGDTIWSSPVQRRYSL